MAMFIRYQSPVPDGRGRYLGVFGLVNYLAKTGQLTDAEEQFRRTNNIWFDTAYPTVPAEIYDHVTNPGASAWFKTHQSHLTDRVPGYLAILDTHSIAWECAVSEDPGRIVYEDPFQVVAVPLTR